MKNLFVPTDFSENARNAAEYAFYFADQILAKVHLHHSYRIDIPVTQDVTQNQIRKWEEEENGKALQEMENITMSIKSKTGTDPDIDFSTSGNNVVESIIEKAKKYKAEMIIMGTKGAGDLRNRFFGSTTVDVLEAAQVPVLCIPFNAKYNVPRKIVYATEYQYADIEAIKKLVNIAVLFNAEITLLHVSKVKDEAEQKLFQERYRIMIEKYFEYDKLSYQVIRSSDIPEALNNYAEKEQVHLLAMSTRRHTVWEKLFDRSTTRYMAYHSNTPLLVFKYQASGYS